jgi:hypothetical protein
MNSVFYDWSMRRLSDECYWMANRLAEWILCQVRTSLNVLLEKPVLSHQAVLGMSDLQINCSI